MKPIDPMAGQNPACARRQALDILCETDPAAKAAATQRLCEDVRVGRAVCLPEPRWDEPAGIPGRPEAPELVAPRLLERRAMNIPAGRAALIHALAHIEFNAINLALDAVWRFNGLPQAFYRDWLRVAAEEACHFTLLADHLVTLGFQYGSFPAHNGLWEMAEKTRHDLLARLALVPRTLEARGLDAGPPIRAKLAQAGDQQAAGILDIILRDEIDHVALGNQWYRWCCERDGRDPHAAYAGLAKTYVAPQSKGPFNLAARRAAGFDDEELRLLQFGAC